MPQGVLVTSSAPFGDEAIEKDEVVDGEEELPSVHSPGQLAIGCNRIDGTIVWFDTTD
jgi:hypothetical protein